LNIIYIRTLIVLFRLAITIKICDAIPLISSLKISIIVEHLLLNFRFTLSTLVIRVPANSSAYISVPAILLNLSIFLLICFRARLKETFLFLNAAKIFYTEFRRFPIPVFIKILIAVSRSIIVIPIYAFTAEKFVLKSVIIF
jgi:ABC-type multidrug transport system permease subunit